MCQLTNPSKLEGQAIHWQYYYVYQLNDLSNSEGQAIYEDHLGHQSDSYIYKLNNPNNSEGQTIHEDRLGFVSCINRTSSMLQWRSSHTD